VLLECAAVAHERGADFRHFAEVRPDPPDVEHHEHGDGHRDDQAFLAGAQIEFVQRAAHCISAVLSSQVKLQRITWPAGVVVVCEFGGVTLAKYGGPLVASEALVTAVLKAASFSNPSPGPSPKTLMTLPREKENEVSLSPSGR